MAITKVDLANVVTGVLPVANGGTGTSSGVSPGGSNTQVQYNSSGTFAGDADFTFNGTTVTMANDASISGLTVGKGTSSSTNNTVVGQNALTTNSTGSANCAFGQYALYTANADANSAFGQAALYLNSSGASNSAFGYQALRNNTTASNNTAVGYQAGYSTTTGSGSNSFFGRQAGYAVTTGIRNTAIGANAMDSGTGGNYNTAVGWNSLANNTADNNTAVGYQAGYSNSTGVENVAIGSQALYSNSTYANHVAVGVQALYSCTGNYNNTAVGKQALYYTNSGGQNTALGAVAGSGITTGSYNTCVGYSAGSSITTASYCTIVGAYNGWAGANNLVILSDGQANIRYCYNGTDYIINGGSIPSATGNPSTNAMSIGGSGWYVSLTGANNYWNHSYNGTQYNFRYQGSGSGQIVVNNGSVAYQTSSDYRLKENVQPMTGALARVAQLRPVTFTFKSSGEASEGFIAHELQAVCPIAVSGVKDQEVAMGDVKDVDGRIIANSVEQPESLPEGQVWVETGLEPKYQGVDTSFLVATLTAAIQELNAKVTALEAQLAAK